MNSGREILVSFKRADIVENVPSKQNSDHSIEYQRAFSTSQLNSASSTGKASEKQQMALLEKLSTAIGEAKSEINAYLTHIIKQSKEPGMNALHNSSEGDRTDSE